MDPPQGALESANHCSFTTYELAHDPGSVGQLENPSRSHSRSLLLASQQVVAVGLSAVFGSRPR